MLETIKNYFRNAINWEDILTNLLDNAVRMIISVVVLTVIYNVALRLSNLYFKHNIKSSSDVPRKRTLQSLTKNIISYTYYFMMGYTLLAILGVPVATLLAGAGVASLAIGFGAQGLVSDTVNGFFILLEHQFDVGDWVKISGVEGTVKQVGLKTTVVEEFNGEVYYIPNRNIDVVTNISRNPRRIDVDLSYYADTDQERYAQVVNDALEKLMADDTYLKDDTPTILGVTRNDKDELIYRVRLWIDSDAEQEEIAKYTEGLHKALAEAGIEMPEGEFSHVRYANFKEIAGDDQAVDPTIK
ncbi:MAG: mechanosensitive ion channel family protein [Aerococcus sp.]|nr:mechanosensitive ion channel family protein [Aerococcus sp.]